MNESAAAQALRESEELHRITLANMSDAVFITDDAGQFTYICPNVDVIFEYAREEVRAMGRISRLLGRDLITPQQPIPDGEIRNIEHEIRTKHGIERQLLIHIKQVSIKGGTVLYVCRDVTARKQAEQALRRNEQRLTLALSAASMGTWDWHVPTGEMTWSPETHRIFGDLTATRRPSFDAFIERLHPYDRGRVSRVMNEAMDNAASYETEFRVVGYDGVERWVMGKGKALRNGIPLRMLGVFVDFTSRHRIERDFRELGGRLIQAQEQERAELAGELNRLAAQAGDTGERLRHLARQLHPGDLEHAGVVESLRALCQEIGKARQLAVNLETSGITRAVPGTLALVVYRITEEALANVATHSGATRAIVTLSTAGNEVFLSVVDGGRGFDVQDVRNKATLGIVGMTERARLVQGQFIVTSKPGGGTRVEFRAPLTAS